MNPDPQPESPLDEAERIRKMHRIRRLILKGKVRLPKAAAARLLGPDTAYHLYRHEGGKNYGSQSDKGKPCP